MAAANQIAAEKPPRARVWVVDDSRLESQRIVKLFAEHYEVEAFSEGGAMLERISSGGVPDLVLLDWQMPGVSGLEACRFLRGRFDEVSLPILMLTSRGAKEDFTEGLSAGANDYVAKPYDDAELLARVRTLVRTRQQAEAIRNDRTKAEEEAKERLDFEEKLIGIVSHDLRNPLNVIFMGAASMLRREDLDERTTKTMMRVQASAERANRLVGDLLDFTRARLGGGIPVVLQPADVHDLVGKSLEEVQAEYSDRNLRAEHEGDGLGEWDAERLSQVFVNLLSNAVKYGLKTSEVVIRSKGLADAVVVEVHNQGAPIAAEVLPVMFQAMKRGVVERTDRSVGLGLYIVKHIVDAHHGTLDVRSTAEEGTTFTVRLPRNASSKNGDA